MLPLPFHPLLQITPLRDTNAKSHERERVGSQIVFAECQANATDERDPKFAEYSKRPTRAYRCLVAPLRS